jgi:glycine/D-amino acid oxidase-like deaminating enzyme
MIPSGESVEARGPGKTFHCIPSAAEVIIIGGGFAGASTAAALTRAGITNGLLLEREPICGSHASGRNAAIARQLEPDRAVGKLAIRGVQRLRAKRVDGQPVLRQTGGLYLIHTGKEDQVLQWTAQLECQDVPFQWLPVAEARQAFPFLGRFHFDYAIFCPTDGVVDIHALLSDLLAEARRGGLQVITGCAVESLILEGSAVRGVRTPDGDIRSRAVVDAAGAWAGHLGRGSNPLPLTPFRRHLFVSSETGVLLSDGPLVWDLDAGYYLRTEGAGLLLCPCDETEHPPGIPAVDFEAEFLLADKLLKYAPALADVTLRGGWACLRTFAPDRRPVIGWDPEIHGLFHVSGLGGFGVTTSLAIGEIASTLICGGVVDWVDTDSFSVGREALRTTPCC